MTDRRSPAVDPRYVEARRVLLDALTALAPHGPALVVAGAQAVYLRTGGGDAVVAPFTTDADLVVGVAPFTTDGDLAVDPTSLVPAPTIEGAMTAAGFELFRMETVQRDALSGSRLRSSTRAR